jgi:hypothetical protein
MASLRGATPYRHARADHNCDTNGEFTAARGDRYWRRCLVICGRVAGEGVGEKGISLYIERSKNSPGSIHVIMVSDTKFALILAVCQNARSHEFRTGNRLSTGIETISVSASPTVESPDGTEGPASVGVFLRPFLPKFR